MSKGSLIPLMAAIAVLAVGVGIYAMWPRLAPSLIKQLPITDSSMSPSPTTADNLPPLYPGVEWGGKQEGKYLFPDSKEVSIELEGYLIESGVFENPNLSDQFFVYYEQELKKRGWTLDDLAGGGASGETRSYKSGTRYFVTRSHTAPSPHTGYQLIVMYSK